MTGLLERVVLICMLIGLAATAARAQVHPSILVTGDDCAAMRQRAARHPYSAMIARARANVEAGYLEDWPDPYYLGRVLPRRMVTVLESVSLLYIIDHEDEAKREQYRAMLVEAVQEARKLQQRDTKLWFKTVPISAVLFEALIALDIMHDDFPAEDRRALERQILQVLEDLYPNAWHPHQYGAWLAWAMYRGDDELLARKREQYLDTLEKKYLRADGTPRIASPDYNLDRFGGPAVERHAKALPLDLLARRGDVELDADSRYIKFYNYVFTATLTPDREDVVFGDSFHVWDEAEERRNYYDPIAEVHDNVRHWWLGRYDSTLARYAAWKRGNGELEWPGSIHLYVFYPGGELAEPLVPPSRLWSTMAALREESDSPEALAGFLHCQTDNASHAHKDVNGVFLSAYGRSVLSNTGYNNFGNGFEGFDWEDIHGRAELNNVVTIDGKDHVAKHGAGITGGLLTDHWELAVGDSGEALPNGTHLRTLAFVHPGEEAPGYFATLDEVSRGAPHIQFHPPSDQVQVVSEASHYRWHFGDGVRMSVMLSRSPKAANIKRGPHAPALIGRYLECVYPADVGPVLTLLVPSDPDHQEPTWSRLEGNGGVTLQPAAGVRDLWLTAPEGTAVDSNGVQFSGKLVFMRLREDQPAWIGLHEVSDFTHAASKIEIQAAARETLFLDLDTATLTTGEATYRLPGQIDAKITIDAEHRVRMGDRELAPLAPATDARQTVRTLELARRIADKGVEEIELGHYTGIFLLQSMAELARISDAPADRKRIRDLLMPLAKGERRFGGNFIPYRCGGNAAAILLLEDMLPEAEDEVRKVAEATHERSPRSSDGIITASWCVKGDRVFIDSAFAVTPFLVAAGRHFDRQEWVRDGFEHTAKLYALLTDEETGLVHQGRGFQGEGVISEAYWSRASGWGLIALASLVEYLPPEHDLHSKAAALLRRHLKAALAVQDDSGMWRQVMDQHTTESYVETSGTGMILYALGVALEHDILDASHRPALVKGLRAYLDYIGPDGSIDNTCKGALCPGQGKNADYYHRGWKRNDRHAFAPAVLAFAQAHDIGITELQPRSSSPPSGEDGSPEAPPQGE